MLQDEVNFLWDIEIDGYLPDLANNVINLELERNNKSKGQTENYQE